MVVRPRQDTERSSQRLTEIPTATLLPAVTQHDQLRATLMWMLTTLGLECWAKDIDLDGVDGPVVWSITSGPRAGPHGEG